MRYQKKPDNTPQNDSIAINRKLSEQGAKWQAASPIRSNPSSDQAAALLSAANNLTTLRDKLCPTIKAHSGI